MKPVICARPLRVFGAMGILFFAIQGAVAAAGQQDNLAQRVRDAISTHSSLLNLSVRTDHNGRVELVGQTRTLYDKYRLFDIVSEVRGVREIAEQVVVPRRYIPDAVVKENMREDLDLVPSILEPDRIKVYVDNGLVILRGTVSYRREKVWAETVASWQEGVTSLVNQIRILPPTEAGSDHNLIAVVREVLKNQFPLDPDVQIAVKRGVVAVGGEAFSLWDKEHIAKEVDRIPGVKSVINDLKIEPEYA